MMEVREVVFNYLRRQHTAGQMLNSAKYFTGKKQAVLTWEPLYISVFPTYRCNLNCDMCLTHSTKKSNHFGQKPGKDMDLEMFKKVLSRFKNALAVNLIGNGEPFLNSDLFGMIEYASKVMRMYTFSSSNGVKLNEYAERIINSHLTELYISINGHTSEEFNRMTGMRADLFNAIRNNTIELVRQRNRKGAKVKIAASMILDKLNYKYLQEMIRFVDDLGVDEFYFHQFLPSSDLGFTPAERCLFSDDADVVETFARFNSIRLKAKVKIVLPLLLERVISGKQYCSVPFYNMSVDGDGNIGACCCQLLDLSGNGKFYEQDSWNNAHFQEMRQRFIDQQSQILEPCKWCYNNSGRARFVSAPNPLSNTVHRLFRSL